MSENTIQHNHDNNIVAEKAKDRQDNVSESYSERAKEEYMKGVERARAAAQPFLEKVEGMAQLKKCPTPITHRPKIGNGIEIMGESYKVSSIEVTKSGATIKLNKPSNLMFR